MKKIVYVCDRCKQEIEGNPAKLFSETVDREIDDFVCENPYPVLEKLVFCRSCCDFLVYLITRHCRKGVPAVNNKELEEAVRKTGGLGDEF